MMALVKALVTLALALATVAQQQSSDRFPSFELDVIFPRNETYKAADNFPIAFAVQNLSAIASLGDDFSISWDIMPYTRGVVPGGIDYDSGEFTIPADAPAKDEHATILVATTNATDWSYYRNRDETYMLWWHVRWDHLDRACGEVEGTRVKVFGGIMFSIESSDYPVGKEPDIMQAPECPAYGTFVEILPNATMPECPIVDDGFNTGKEGNPCAVKVDRAALASISSEVLRLGIPTSTSSEIASSTSSGGVGGLYPVQTALGAACVLCGLAL